MVYGNKFSARWRDVDLIRKWEQTCVGLCAPRLGSLLVYTIKDTTPFAHEYLPRVSDYSWAVKGMIKIYSWAFTSCHKLLTSTTQHPLHAFWPVHSSSTRTQLASFLQDLSRHKGKHMCDCKLSCRLYCKLLDLVKLPFTANCVMLSGFMGIQCGYKS